jgi:hypothetical protein
VEDARLTIRRAPIGVQLLRLRLALRRYDPNQPRVPAGNADGGQWTNGDSRTRAPADADPDADVHITLAGGFTKDQLNLTVDDFVAQNCTGYVRRDYPVSSMDRRSERLWRQRGLEMPRLANA